MPIQPSPTQNPNPRSSTKSTVTTKLQDTKDKASVTTPIKMSEEDFRNSKIFKSTLTASGNKTRTKRSSSSLKGSTSEKTQTVLAPMVKRGKKDGNASKSSNLLSTSGIQKRSITEETVDGDTSTSDEEG